MTKLCKVKVPNGSLPQADLDGDGRKDWWERHFPGARLMVEKVDGKRTGRILCEEDTAGDLRPIDFAHEAGHILRGQGNKDFHHPALHFCGRVGHALRFFDAHLASDEMLAGNRLFRAKWGEWVEA